MWSSQPVLHKLYGTLTALLLQSFRLLKIKWILFQNRDVRTKLDINVFLIIFLPCLLCKCKEINNVLQIEVLRRESLKIPKRLSESVYRWRTDNTMAKRKSTWIRINRVQKIKRKDTKQCFFTYVNISNCYEY